MAHMEEDFWHRKPHFFKVLVGDFSEKLRIPPAFVKHISEETSRAAILVGRGGSQWRVELSQGGNSVTYLEEGWGTFVKENSLQESNFLLFRYEGGLRFRVTAYDASACQKEDLLTDKNCEASTFGDSKKKLERSETFFADFPKRRSCSGSEKRSLHAKEDKLQQVKIEQKVVEPTNVMIEENGADSKSYVSAKRRVALLEARDTFTSKFPFFIKRLTESSVGGSCGGLGIPTGFSRTHLPRKSTKIVLLDPEGRAWKVNYRVTTFKASFYGGWPAFSRSNKLGEGDVCIFELIMRSRMRVHIFPSVAVASG